MRILPIQYPLLALSLLVASPSLAQKKTKKPSAAEEIAALKSEILKLQTELQTSKENQQSNEAKQLALEEKYKILAEQLLTISEKKDPENEILQAALEEGNAKTIALENKISELSQKIALQENKFVEGGLRIYGYLSEIARYIDLPDITDANGKVDPKRDVDFFNNVVEVDFDRSYEQKANIRVDLDALFNPQGGGKAFLLEVEQAYVQLNTLFGQELNLSVGRFDAPWGFEPVDAPGNYCVTRSNLFQLIRPKLMTGALASYGISETSSASLYVVNGLEDNVDVKNNAKTLGARLELTSSVENETNSWSLGLNLLAGSEQPTALIQEQHLFGLLPDPTILVGIDFQKRYDNLLIGGDLLLGTINNAQNAIEANLGSNPIAGVNLTLHYDFTPRLGYTFRYDALRDHRGALLGASGAVPLYPARDPNADPSLNFGGALHSVTADLNLNLLPNTTTQTFFELRLDRVNPTEDTLESKSAATVSMQFIYNY